MSEISDARLGELEALASKSVILGAILGLLLGPLGYVYVGQWRWATINFFTLNYLILGIVIVPIHVVAMILEARTKVRRVKSSNDTDTESESESDIWRRLGAWYQSRREG